MFRGPEPLTVDHHEGFAHHQLPLFLFRSGRSAGTYDMRHRSHYPAEVRSLIFCWGNGNSPSMEGPDTLDFRVTGYHSKVGNAARRFCSFSI